VRFVQDRVWRERERIAELFRAGATVYVCGDGARMAPAVRSAVVRIYADATGKDQEAAEAWVDDMEHGHGRYVSAVFA